MELQGIVYTIMIAFIEGLILALVTLAFQLIYGSFKFFDMSIGTAFIGAVYFYLLGEFIASKLKIESSMICFIITYIISLSLSICLSLFTGLILYNKFIKKKASALILMIVSLSVYAVLLNIFILFNGDEPQTIEVNEWFEKPIIFLGSSYINTNFLQGATSIFLILIFFVFLRFSKFGNKTIALSDNPKYFEIIGLSAPKTKVHILVISAILVNSASLLKTSEVSMVPHVAGFQYVILAAVAMIIGGLDSYKFAIIGSILLMMIINLTEWFLPGEWGIWKYAMVFVVLIIVLLIRPKGLKYIKLRAEE